MLLNQTKKIITSRDDKIFEMLKTNEKMRVCGMQIMSTISNPT